MSEVAGLYAVNPFPNYPGSKAGSGVYQRLINLMPPHQTYIEPFLGGGAVLRWKRPALANIAIDINPHVIAEWQTYGPVGFELELWQGDALALLPAMLATQKSDTLVYCDPPYLMSTRSSQRQLYAFEMADECEHARLLDVLLALPCMVMVSGYWSELYADRLSTWRTYTYQAMTRGGTLATEWVWLNFPQPFALHDYKFLGDTFRERERLKKKKMRWCRRLESMPELERLALLDVISDHTTPAPAIAAESVVVDGT